MFKNVDPEICPDCDSDNVTLWGGTMSVDYKEQWTCNDCTCRYEAIYKLKTIKVKGR